MRRLLLAPLLVLALAACGDEGDEGGDVVAQGSEDATVSLGDAVERTEAETARFALDASVEVTGGAEPVDVSADGVVDFPGDQSRMELDFSEIVEFGGAGAPSDWRGDAIYERDTIFIRLPGLTNALPEKVEWLEVDAGTLAEQGGTQFNAPDPREFVRFVAALDDVEVVGSEEIRDVETEHLRGTVAVAELAAASRPADRKQVAAYARRLRTAGLTEFPLDVWVDDEGLIRRLRAEYENLATGGASASLDTRIDFYDFGVEATIEPPPRSEVTPFGELIGRGAEETKHSEE